MDGGDYPLVVVVAHDVISASALVGIVACTVHHTFEYDFVPIVLY